MSRKSSTAENEGMMGSPIAEAGELLYRLSDDHDVPYRRQQSDGL
jgi:hypothetical protein